MKEMSPGISGGKYVVKFANTVNRGRVSLLSQFDYDFSHANLQLESSTSLTSLLLAVRTPVFVTASKNVLAMITFTHNFLLASIHFLLFRINKLDLNFLYRQTLSLTCPLRNHVTSFLSRQSLSACKMAQGLLNCEWRWSTTTECLKESAQALDSSYWHYSGIDESAVSCTLQHNIIFNSRWHRQAARGLTFLMASGPSKQRAVSVTQSRPVEIIPGRGGLRLFLAIVRSDIMDNTICSFFIWTPTLGGNTSLLTFVCYICCCCK